MELAFSMSTHGEVASFRSRAVKMMDRPAAVRYSVAVVVAAAALYARHLLTPYIGLRSPYHTVWFAVVLCSWYCGLGPSIVGSLICGLGVDYFFLASTHSFRVSDPLEAASIVTFFVFAAVVITLGEANRRTLRARQLAEAKLQAANDSLESNVKARTEELQEKNQELQRQAAVVRALTGHLLRLQDEERRRIARELHDSVGQSLAAISINTSAVCKESNALSAEARRCLEENAALVSQTSAEIRTLSHLLHPPLLDEAGLEHALHWLVDGFTNRSKIRVELDIAPPFERLAADEELVIFRIVQECLTNIHRHSGSSTARLFLSQDDGFVHCEISDDGAGFPPEKQDVLHSAGAAGVGLRGMQERVNQLGGVLDVYSTSKGTTVTVDLPLQPHSQEPASRSQSTASSAA